MRDRLRRYWETHREDAGWWACIAAILVALYLIVLSPIVFRIWLDPNYAVGYTHCLPSKMYGWICKGDKR